MKNARDVDKERDVLIANLEKKISSFQEHADRLRTEHSSKIEELMTNHKNEIAASHASIQEAEAMHEKQLAQSIQDLEDAKRIAVSQCSEEAASTLASHIDTHKVKLEALEQQLSDKTKQSLKIAARVQRLQSEISDLQALLAEERQKSTDVSQGYQENHNKALEEKDHDLAKLQKAIEDLQIVHRNELKEKESIQVETNSINSERDTLRHELHELDTTHRSTVASHEKELASKQRQMDGLGRVIKEFQDKIQKIHELKEQTVHETKLDLAHEHERVLSDLRREHQEEIAGVALEHSQKSQSLQEEHQNLMHSAQIIHENEVERIQELLKESERSLEEAKLASEKAESAGNAFNLKIHNLELERDEAENARLSMENALNDASTVIVSLKKSFELLSAESLNKDAQQKAAIQSLRDELINKSKLYADSMDSVEEKGQRSLEDLQKQYDALLEKWSSTEKDHPAILDTLKREHAEAAQKQAEALKDLSNTHVKEIEATVAEAEEKHQQNLKDLQQKYDERYDLLRQDWQDTENAKNQFLQKEHDITVSDLRSQLQKHTELLANAEDQLQVFRSTQNTDTNLDENDDLRQQLEELRAQLANSQAQVAQTNEEIANLAGSLEDARKALEDTSELNSLRLEMTELAKKHAAEIAKYQDKISLENEKREKERNQGAEVRDRLASEAEKTTNELLAARAEIDEHQKALHLSSNKLKEASKKHATVHQSAERHKNEYEKVVEKLRVAQAEIEKYKAAELGSESEEVQPNAQELEALQLAADAERTQNAELKGQLQEAKALAEQRAIKLREVESALKVTTAELVEAQTARPNGGEFSASPAPRSGLRSSRWGTTAKTDDERDSMEQEGEELGSSIEGNVGSLFYPS